MMIFITCLLFGAVLHEKLTGSQLVKIVFTVYIIY